jgi:uncharacterized protein YukE
MSELMHVDPAKLRLFAEELGRTLAAYKQAMEHLDARLSRLGSSWRDQEFDTFSNELRNTKRTVAEFIQEGEAARASLLRDAERAEDYQRKHAG